MFFAIPVAAVATENSGHRLRRGPYAAQLALVIALVVPALLLTRYVGLTGLALLMAIVFWFYRMIVKRARDSGLGKGICYAAVIPLVNLIVAIYLLFRPSAAAAADRPTEHGPADGGD